MLVASRHRQTSLQEAWKSQVGNAARRTRAARAREASDLPQAWHSATPGVAGLRAVLASAAFRPDDSKPAWLPGRLSSGLAAWLRLRRKSKPPVVLFRPRGKLLVPLRPRGEVRHILRPDCPHLRNRRRSGRSIKLGEVNLSTSSSARVRDPLGPYTGAIGVKETNCTAD